MAHSGSASALTYQTAADVSFTINPSLTVSLSDADLIIDNLAPGTASDSNIITVSVSTNAAYGYVLNANVGQPTKYETRNLILSGADANFASVAFGSSLASITTDNTWGFSYKTSESGATWTNYSGLPQYDDETNTTTLISTTETTGDESVDFKIAARAGTTQPGGEYKNVINFIAVANPEPELEPVACEQNKICYNVNSLGPTEGTMGKQTKDDSNKDITGGSTVTLLASNFSRTGYGFAGWSDVYDYATNSSAHFYGPQETITTPSDMSNGLPLYAVWVKSEGSLQDTAKVAELCGTGSNALVTAPTDGTANLDSVSALTDGRDNQTYAIAKLADGKCWMIENLRLESTNSDNSTGALAQGYGTSATYGNFSGLADAESTGFTSTYTANSLYYSGTQEGTASIDIGTSDYPGYRMPRYNNINTSTRASSPTSNGVAMYSYGNYYTWHAAIADLTYNGTNNQSATNTSLCPTGWRLPQGGNKTRIESNDDNDFWNLTVDALNGGTNPANYDSDAHPYYTGTAEAGPVADKLRSYPNNFLYSGNFDTSSARYRGSNGYYWSSTASSSYNSYRLSLTSSSVYPGNNSNTKYNGYSIRCTVSAGT